MATATNPKGITLYKNENDCYYYINQNGEHIFLGTGITHLDTDMSAVRLLPTPPNYIPYPIINA